MIAVVVRIEDVADRLVGRLLDGGDHVAGFLGEVGVDDQDVILEDDPDVVAAAEWHVLVGGADRRVAEEDARGDLLDLVEFHRRQVGGRRGGDGQQPGEHPEPRPCHTCHVYFSWEPDRMTQPLWPTLWGKGIQYNEAWAPKLGRWRAIKENGTKLTDG